MAMTFLRITPQRHVQVFSRVVLSAIAFGLSALAFAAPAAAANNKLQIYFMDVEGGQATLFVTPAGQSLLIDTGWPGNDGRDADRIVAAAKHAGLSRIDYVLLTHFHDDHVGGVPQLVERIPVGTFIDHGPNRETSNAPTEHNWEVYQKVLADGKYEHIVAKPGDVLPIAGMSAVVVSADGNLIDHPLAGGGEKNSYCATSEVRPADQTENARSLGVFITFGKLKILDLGDLTWDKEMQLMCPVNKLGHVDLLVVSHHGWYQSSSPALVYAISPVVAIMDNGATKGGSIPTLDTIRKSPGLQAPWQLHFSQEGGAEHNAAEEFIANVQGTDHGYGLSVAASKDGKFTVTNPRNHLAKDYQAR